MAQLVAIGGSASSGGARAEQESENGRQLREVARCWLCSGLSTKMRRER